MKFYIYLALAIVFLIAQIDTGFDHEWDWSRYYGTGVFLCLILANLQEIKEKL